MMELKNLSGQAIYRSEKAKTVRELVLEALKFKLNLNNLDLFKANLSGLDLSGISLIGSNLVEANLSNTYLTKANLSNANLSAANLSCSNLIDAILIDADFSRANFSSANLYGADLSGTNLSEAILIGSYKKNIKTNNAIWTIPLGNNSDLRVNSKEKHSILFIENKQILKINKVYPIDSDPFQLAKLINSLNLS